MGIAAYFLGSIGMLQSLLLPGLCLTVCLQSWNWPQRLLFAPAFSLLLNYYLVWALSSLGLYGQVSMLGILTLELAWIIFRIKKLPVSPFYYQPLERWAEPVFFILAVAAIAKYSQAWVRNFGDVFLLWDAVVSWNEWARDWFYNTRPNSYLYPHALPIAYSIPYAFMGGSGLEMFSKATIGIIFLCGLGALLELGFRRKDLRLLAWMCAFVYPAIQAKFMQSHWNSGYADIPLALMLLFAFCISFFPGKATPWLFGFISGAAPLVKQPGLLFAAISPLLYQDRYSIRSSFRQITMAAIVAAGPWYLFIVSNIYLLKQEENNVSYLSNLVSGGLTDRWAVAIKLLLHFAGAPFLIAYFLLSMIGAALSKEARRWWLLLGLPYFLVWGTFFAYDIRNLSMALFPMALAISAFFSFVGNKIQVSIQPICLPKSKKFLLGSKFLGYSAFGIIIVLNVISLKRPIGHWIENGSAWAWERKQRLNLGDAPQANQYFAGLVECQQSTLTRFLTNYWWPRAIPQISRVAVQSTCAQIRDAVIKRDKAYIYLRVPDCEIEAAEAITLYEENDFRILTGNTALASACRK